MKRKQLHQGFERRFPILLTTTIYIYIYIYIYKFKKIENLLYFHTVGFISILSSSLCFSLSLYIYIYIYIIVKVLANGLGDPGSVPGRVMPKTQKWYLMPSCLIFIIIKYESKVSGAIQGKEKYTFLYFDVVARKSRLRDTPRLLSTN